MSDYSKEFEAISRAYESSGGESFCYLTIGSPASWSAMTGSCIPTQVSFLAHCSFPNAVRAKHVMRAGMHVGKGAEMEYSETHYHGDDGGVEVLPVAHITVDERGIYNRRCTRRGHGLAASG